MNGEVKSHPITFKNRSTKKIEAQGLQYERPYRIKVDDSLIGRCSCDNCIYQRGYADEEGTILPEGTQFEESDYDTDIKMEDGSTNKIKIFYWCQKGNLKLELHNAPCVEWSNEDDKLNEDGSANLVNYHQTDYGNAERLIAVYGDVIRYCYDYEKWYYWDNKRWKQDSGERLMIYAKNTVRQLFDQANNLDDKERRKFIDFALDCEGAARLNAMIKLSESEKTINRDVLDTDRFKFNFTNCTMDLKKPIPYKHDMYDYISKISSTPLDMTADYSEWVSFLNVAFKNDTEIISAIQRCLGYCLTGDIGENVFFILHGVGNNGKSTFLNTILHIFGEYGTSINSDTIMVKKNQDDKRTDLARLVGIRFIACSEGMEGGRLNEATVKQVTGGDTVICRFLYGNEFAYIPEYKIWYATNHKPDIRTTDEGTWRRIVYIPFDVNIPAALKQLGKPRITNYDQILIKNSAGIMRWMIEGLLDYYRRGGLDIPQKMLDKVKEYRAEMDQVQTWIDEEADDVEDAFTLNSDLLGVHNLWARRNGYEELKPKIFSARLNEKGYKSAKGGHGARGKSGIKIKEAALKNYLRSNIGGDQREIGGDTNTSPHDRHTTATPSPLADYDSDNLPQCGDCGDDSSKVVLRAEIKKMSESAPTSPHRHTLIQIDYVSAIKEQIKEMSDKLYEGTGAPESGIIEVMSALGFDKERTIKEIKKLLEIGELFYPKEGILSVS